jgi:hypothetical protein
MFKITINHKSGRKSYPIYTEKEAVEKGLDFKMHNPNYKTQKFYAEGRSTPWTLSGKPALEVQSRSHKWKNLALAYVSTNFDADLAIDMVMGQTTPQQRRRWKRNIRKMETQY